MQNEEHSFRWQIGLSASNYFKLIPLEILSIVFFPIGIAKIFLKPKWERDYYVYFTARSVYLGTLKRNVYADFTIANFYDPHQLRRPNTKRMFPKVAEIPYYQIQNTTISKNGWDLIIITDTYKTKIRIDTPDKNLIFKVQNAFNSRIYQRDSNH